MLSTFYVKYRRARLLMTHIDFDYVSLREVGSRLVELTMRNIIVNPLMTHIDFDYVSLRETGSRLVELTMSSIVVNPL